MSHELLYTSAPRGLQAGTRGFCTVAATDGISTRLLTKLEAMSGYRPLFPPLDAKVALNPVLFSHLRVEVGNKSSSVLSRICASGLDYTDRANKFAHHVVLESGELPAGGPAWLLSQPGFMYKAWDDKVRILPKGRKLPQGDFPTKVCKAWQTVTGDAGWAGVLAESFSKDPNRPAFLLFEPGTDLLPLVLESLSLFPPPKRWEVTFSTYFTGLPPGIACAWRCVPVGSDESRETTRLPNALVLTLGHNLGRAEGGALVDQARTGRAPTPLPKPSKEFSGPSDSRHGVNRNDPFPDSPYSLASTGLPEEQSTKNPKPRPVPLGVSPKKSSPGATSCANKGEKDEGSSTFWPIFVAGMIAGSLLTIALMLAIRFTRIAESFREVGASEKIASTEDRPAPNHAKEPNSTAKPTAEGTTKADATLPKTTQEGKVVAPNPSPTTSPQTPAQQHPPNTPANKEKNAQPAAQVPPRLPSGEPIVDDYLDLSGENLKEGLDSKSRIALIGFPDSFQGKELRRIEHDSSDLVYVIATLGETYSLFKFHINEKGTLLLSRQNTTAEAGEIFHQVLPDSILRVSGNGTQNFYSLRKPGTGKIPPIPSQYIVKEKRFKAALTFLPENGQALKNSADLFLDSATVQVRTENPSHLVDVNVPKTKHGGGNRLEVSQAQEISKDWKLERLFIHLRQNEIKTAKDQKEMKAPVRQEEKNTPKEKITRIDFGASIRYSGEHKIEKPPEFLLQKLTLYRVIEGHRVDVFRIDEK